MATVTERAILFMSEARECPVAIFHLPANAGSGIPIAPRDSSHLPEIVLNFDITSRPVLD